MKRKIRYIQYGCGKMGSLCMKYALDRGVDIVAAYDLNPKAIGKDAGEWAGLQSIGIKISDAANFEKEVGDFEADIVVVTTLSLLRDIYSTFKICAERGINAISSCEEAIYPGNSAVRITGELDEIANQNNCTLTGSGAQEMQWGSMINNLAGSLNKIIKIEGVTQNNVDDYGIAFANSFGAGMDKTTFEREVAAAYNLSDEEVGEQIEKGEFIPGFMWNSNTWLAEKLGLTTIKQSQKLEPHMAEEDINSSTLGKVIPKGEIKGASQIVRTETKEGIVIESAVKAVVYGPNDFEYNDWVLHGENEVLKVSLPNPPTVEMTCATLINRIPDVINAEAGYVPTSKMPNCTYLVKSMENYVK